ncbi:hypothetical protein BH09BAC1_BH09BAC1_28970 [soil metagenome]
MDLRIEGNNTAYPFLDDGGEMGALTREYNWAQTPVGEPNTWSVSLCTMVATVLSSRFPMLLWWGDEMIQFYNDAYRPSLGNNGKHPMALGQKAIDCWPEIWDIIHPLIQQVRTTGKATWSEDQLIPIFRNGKIEDVYWTFGYSAVKDKLGKVEGILVVCNETTEKVKAAKKVEQSELRLRSLVTAAPVAIGLFVGRDLIVEMPNLPFIEIVGKGPDIEGMPLREVMPELITENQPYLQILDDVYTTGIEFKTFGSLVQIVRDGILSNGYYNFTYTPLFDDNGQVYAILDIAIDVTEQVIAREKLAQSEKNLRNTILKAPVAMCILRGPEFVIEIANDRIVELWGKDSTIIGKTLLQGLPEIEGQGFIELLQGVYHTGVAHNAYGVPVGLLRNGVIEEVFVTFVYEAYRETADIINGIIVVAYEVTDQVLAQRKIEEMVAERTIELATANNELQRSNAELAQFAYIASHDLQEPLRKVSTFTQMLEHTIGEDINDRAKSYINKINSSAERMTDLVRDVLSYSQLSREEEKYAPVDLQRVIDAIVTDFELLIEQKQAIIDYRDLPTIEAIPLHMSQLFGNLISNALKFTQPGKLPVISIGAKLLEKEKVRSLNLPLTNIDYYQISITDNGIGFDNEHAEQIFNIFQRLHGRSAYTGTGIGLAICKKIVQNHQGQIHASGVAEGGAVFKVILPVTQG